MKRLLVLAALAVTLPGCAGAQKAIADAGSVAATVVTKIQEAEQWINLVADVADLVFRNTKTPEAEQSYRRAEQSVRLALAGLTSAASAVKSVSDGEYMTALGEFESAWRSFLAAAKSSGVVAANGSLMAAKAGKVQPVEVPELALLKR